MNDLPSDTVNEYLSAVRAWRTGKQSAATKSTSPAASYHFSISEDGSLSPTIAEMQALIADRSEQTATGQSANAETASENTEGNLTVALLDLDKIILTNLRDRGSMTEEQLVMMSLAPGIFTYESTVRLRVGILKAIGHIKEVNGKIVPGDLIKVRMFFRGEPYCSCTPPCGGWEWEQVSKEGISRPYAVQFRNQEEARRWLRTQHPEATEVSADTATRESTTNA